MTHSRFSPPLGRVWPLLASLPARLLMALIRVYQRTLSPALPVLLGPACGCRFSPTCSHYTLEAIRTHGAALGVLLGAIRLVKCTPLHPGGLDPVPARGEAFRRRKPACHSVSRPRDVMPAAFTASPPTSQV